MRALLLATLLMSASASAAEAPSPFGPLPAPETTSLREEPAPAARPSAQELKSAFAKGQRLSRVGEGLVYTSLAASLVVTAVATTQVTLELLNDPDFDPETADPNDVELPRYAAVSGPFIAGVTLVGTGLLLGGNHISRNVLQQAGATHSSTLGYTALGLSIAGWALWPVGLLTGNAGVSTLSSLVTTGGLVCAVIERYQIRKKGRDRRLSSITLPNRRGDLLAISAGAGGIGVVW